MIKNKYYKLDYKQNIKIALLADIHFNIKYNHQIFLDIINNLKKNKPDVICVVGDIIDSSDILEKETLKMRLFKFFLELSKISKVLISIGNHEKIYGNKYIENHNLYFLKEIKNVYILDNENYIYKNVNFIGIDPRIEYYEKKENVDILIEEFNKISNKIDKNKINILLCHSPISILDNKMFLKTNINDINLILSGHMHNGLVASFLNKSNRGIVGPYHNFFPKHARGLEKYNNVTLIITGGVIKLSYRTNLNKFNKIFASSLDYIDI